MTKITFLGTGTSQGIPVVSCGCWVCASNDKRDNRLRSSVMIEQGDVRLIIDAGPDFREQMLRENVKRIDAILLTHEHKDHIGGIDDVRAFNYTSRQPVKIYATERVQEIIKKDFDYAFGDNKYPGVPEIDLITFFPDTQFAIEGVEIIPVSGKHHKLPVHGFRIGNIAYLTDFNHIEESEIEKIKNVDILVINALRRENHISHYTLDQALHIAYLVQAKETYFTHVSHQMGRHMLIDRELPNNTHFAYDGLTLESIDDK